MVAPPRLYRSERTQIEHYIWDKPATFIVSGLFTSPSEPIPGFAFMDLRTIWRNLSEAMFLISGRAIQLLAWDSQNRYCGKCGSPTLDKDGERVKVCTQCGLLRYPKISPAVIVAVVRDDTILLAKNKQSPIGFYSMLAGFVEPGESLETCVKREIFEEVGLQVANVRYFGSQPWPFPDSLMLGFTAEYAEGEITVDGVEIAEATWFGVNDLPKIPPVGSISRKLIDWFVASRPH